MARTKKKAAERTIKRTIKNSVKDCPAQLEIKHLKFDQYQDARKKSAVAWVRQNLRKFDAAKLGVIDVSYRAGEYWVVDGMARVLLLKEVGGTHVWAVVNRGLTYEEEADRFVILNKERRKTTAFQEFYGEHEARKPHIVAIVKLCKEYGYDILSEAPGNNVIRCYRQIRQIVALPNGFDVLEQVFRVTRTCWGDWNATHGDLLRGLAHFVQQHGDVPGVMDRMTEKLFGVHPKKIQAEAYLKRGGNSGGGGYKMIYAILLDRYNKGSASKLPLRLRTPLVRRIIKQAAGSSVPLESLADVFKRDVRGPAFLFRKGGAKALAKRLDRALGEQNSEQFAGAKFASTLRAYLREQRKTFSPQMAEACERWGVKYQDLLLRKRKTSKTHKKGSNGHTEKKVEGEVIFDATSSLSVLEQSS